MLHEEHRTKPTTLSVFMSQKPVLNEVINKEHRTKSATKVLNEVIMLHEEHRTKLATKVLVATLQDGGCTVSTRHAFKPGMGYMVAINPIYERVYHLGSFCLDDILDYISSHSPLLMKDYMYLGSWVDGDKVYLDISERFATKSEALEAAQQRRQLAYYDLSINESVRVN